MTARIAVVANSKKLSKKDGGELRHELESRGLTDILWIGVDKASDTTKAVKRALKDGAERIIVSGGDGSVRAGIEALVGTDIPMAVMPAGTANLFATGLNLPTDAAGVAEAAQAGNLRRLDTGTCNGLAFGVMAGTGFDAMMIEEADADKERLGTLAYVRAGLKASRERKPFQAKVKLDGDIFFDGEATCVLVGNLGTLKGGIEAFPDAQPNDGLLDVAVVTASGMREWGSVMLSALRRKQSLSGHAHLGQGSAISVRLDGQQTFELDGGAKGRAKRLDFTVEPASLLVCTLAAA
jgi:diacylglycerol kinase (ATP)